MKSIFTVANVLMIVAVFGLRSAPADPFTLCVKDANGRMNRGALGGTPAKGGCKNTDKWTQVTLATEDNVLELANELDALNNEINGPDGIAERVEANTNQLELLQAEGISSLIGGGHDQEEGPFFTANVTRYMRLFGTELSDTESKVTSMLAATGQIRRLSVVVDESPGQIVLSRYNLVVNGQIKFLDPRNPFGCAIGEGTMCNAEGCLKVNAGDTLSLAVEISNVQSFPATIHPARWTARFIETEADCPPLAQ